MCTRFVYRGDDMITGFNFDIDLTVWDHKIIKEKDRFYIGILRPDGNYHCYNVVDGRAFDLTSEQFPGEVLCYGDNPRQERKRSRIWTE